MISLIVNYDCNDQEGKRNDLIGLIVGWQQVWLSQWKESVKMKNQKNIIVIKLWSMIVNNFVTI